MDNEVIAITDTSKKPIYNFTFLEYYPKKIALVQKIAVVQIIGLAPNLDPDLESYFFIFRIYLIMLLQ